MNKELGKVIDLDVLLSIYFNVLIAPAEKIWDDLCFLTEDEISYEQIVPAMSAVAPYIEMVFPEIALVESLNLVEMKVTIDGVEYDMDDISIAFAPMPDEMKYIREPQDLVNAINVCGTDVQMLQRLGKHYNS